MSVRRGLWWARPGKRTVRHLAAITGSTIDTSGQVAVYRTACGNDIVRRPGDPHPADAAYGDDRPPCRHCLVALERRIEYYAAILDEASP